MTHPIRAALPALLLSTVCALPMLARAQLTGNVALTTDCKFRGQDQDMLGHGGNAKTGAVKPAVQGGFDCSLGDGGFDVGNWNANDFGSFGPQTFSPSNARFILTLAKTL